MARIIAPIVALLAISAVFAQSQQQPKGEKSQPASQRESELKEEDTGVSVDREYVFNPVQAAQELKVGDFYWKKGSHKAAAGRYEEATKWNPMLSDAWRKLGEAREKLKDTKGAAEAYKKYLEVAPDSSDAKDIRKKLDKLS